MEEKKMSSEAGRLYVLAYEMHYLTRDIQKAFTLYEAVIKTHPETKEADYARSQVLNIVDAIVPKKEILDTLIDLARLHFKNTVKSDSAPVLI